MQPEITEKVVKKAIDIGYRHIDTSFSYGNENEIGRAINAKIAEGVITRRDIFVTTKVKYRSNSFVQHNFQSIHSCSY